MAGWLGSRPDRRGAACLGGATAKVITANTMPVLLAH